MFFICIADQGGRGRSSPTTTNEGTLTVETQKSVSDIESRIKFTNYSSLSYMEKLMLKKQRKEKIFDATDPLKRRKCISAKTYQVKDKNKQNNTDRIGYIKECNSNISNKNNNNNNQPLIGFGKNLQHDGENQLTAIISDVDSNNNTILFKKRDWRNKHHLHMMASYFEIGVASPDLIHGAFESENASYIIIDDNDSNSIVIEDIDGSNTITVKNDSDGYWRPASSVNAISIEPLDDE